MLLLRTSAPVKHPLSVGYHMGAVLGPILFLILINNPTDIVKYSIVHLFADELHTYICQLY